MRVHLKDIPATSCSSYVEICHLCESDITTVYQAFASMQCNRPVCLRYKFSPGRLYICSRAFRPIYAKRPWLPNSKIKRSIYAESQLRPCRARHVIEAVLNFSFFCLSLRCSRWYQYRNPCSMNYHNRSSPSSPSCHVSSSARAEPRASPNQHPQLLILQTHYSAFSSSQSLE